MTCKLTSSHVLYLGDHEYDFAPYVRLGPLLDVFMAALSAIQSPNEDSITQRNTNNTLMAKFRAFMSFLIEYNDGSKVSIDAVLASDYLAHLSANYSPQTVSTYWSVAQRIMTFAIDNGMMVPFQIPRGRSLRRIRLEDTDTTTLADLQPGMGIGDYDKANRQLLALVRRFCWSRCKLSFDRLMLGQSWLVGSADAQKSRISDTRTEFLRSAVTRIGKKCSRDADGVWYINRAHVRTFIHQQSSLLSSFSPAIDASELKDYFYPSAQHLACFFHFLL